ncbi:HAD-IA family hydrolase [Nannocystaceae bacterium ST9]
MDSPPTLLLDVLDTLVHDPFFHEVPEFFALDFEALLASKDRQAWLDFERGSIGEAELAERYFTDRRPLDLAGLRSCMHASYRFLPGIEPLLGELREREVEMHALSNYPVWWRLIEDRLGLSRFLAWSFVSCETGVRKPDPQAFLGAAARLGVPASECLLIDDRLENCRAAEAIGMPALRFVDADALRVELRDRGVLA